jgi:glutamate/tyrosine decarboxylase-like PLP-dependent enzyme
MIDQLKSIGDKSFTIKGYQRSDGSVVNLLVRMLPPGGYKKLIEDSIECIDQFSELLDNTIWEPVRDEVLTSLTNSLGEKPKRVSYEQITSISDNLALLDNDPDKVILFGTEILNTETVVEPSKVTKSRDDKSAAKKRLMAALPIGRFCFRLNLYQGKYESVES